MVVGGCFGLFGWQRLGKESASKKERDQKSERKVLKEKRLPWGKEGN